MSTAFFFLPLLFLSLSLASLESFAKWLMRWWLLMCAGGIAIDRLYGPRTVDDVCGPYRTLYYTRTQLVLLRKQCFPWKLSFYERGTLRRLDRIRKFLPICSSALISLSLSLSHTLSHSHYNLTVMAADRGKNKWEPRGKANLLSFSGAAVVFFSVKL